MIARTCRARTPASVRDRCASPRRSAAGSPTRAWARRRRSSTRRRCRSALWQAAQFSRNSVPPSARSPAAGSTSGIGGPSPRDATYATRASISSGENAGGLRTACALGVGQRHAAGGELEVGRGGADADQRRVRRAVPPPSAPWQPEHDVRKSSRPRSTSAGSSAAAWARSAPGPRDGRRREHDDAPAGTRRAGVARRRTRRPPLPQHEQGQEQEDPDDVDEVPEVADGLDGGRSALERARARW